MVTVSYAEVKARLGDLLDRVEAGKEVTITRDSRPVAQLSRVPVRKRPLDLERLAAFRATIRPLARPSTELLREARDDERE